MGDCGSGRQFAHCSFDIDMDPLIVAGCLSELLDPLLSDLDPVAHPDLCLDGCFDLVEILEDPHFALHQNEAPWPCSVCQPILELSRPVLNAPSIHPPTWMTGSLKHDCVANLPMGDSEFATLGLELACKDYAEHPGAFMRRSPPAGSCRPV